VSSRFLRLRKLIVRGFAISLVLVAAGGPVSANAQVCASQTDMAALNTRVLQTELMVAALTCGQRDNYNEFATHFRQTLVRQGKNLRSLFSRAYGGSANKKLNTFVTRLANDASQRSMTIRNGFCLFAEDLFDEAISTPTGEFSQLLLKPWLRSRHGFAPCSS
jgi:hypothetical protein